MKWWDFTNVQFLILFIILVVGIISATSVAISFSVSANKVLKIQKEIKNESNTIRVYIIDFKNNSVVYFNRSSLANKSKMTLSQFYLRFHEKDVEKLQNWLYALCVENRVVDDYIEVDMVTIKGRNNYYSILKNIKLDAQNGIVHLESHLMKYISSFNSAIKKTRGVISGQVSKSDMRELIQKQKNANGFTFCFRFYYLANKGMGLDRVEKVTVSILKNIIYSYTYNTSRARQIIDELGSELFFFDLNIVEKEKALKLLVNIMHDLKRTIGIKGFDDVGFAVGIVENGQYYQDFDAIIRTSQQACIYAQQNNLDYYFYARSSKIILTETGKYSQEITRLLKPNNLVYSFRPIVDAVKGEVVGYFNYINAPESPFKDFNEMSKYSAKVHRNKEFFAYVSRNVISRFTSETLSNSAKLFMPASLADISFLNDVFRQNVNLLKRQIVLIFSERDFDEEDIDLNSIYHVFKGLKDYNIQTSLLMHDQNLLLDPEVYSNFDYFIVGSSMVKEIRKSKFIRLSIHTLVEQLLKYKRPIIATEMEGWQAIELIVNSGITYISSETISPTNTMILPIDKKKIDKLLTMTRVH